MAQAIVQRACGDLRSAIGDEAVARSEFAGDLLDMLEALEDIQPVLEAADIMLFRVPFVFEWQQSVWDAAYKIMDMADELQDARSLATAQMARMLPCHSIMKYAMAIKVDETKKTSDGDTSAVP